MNKNLLTRVFATETIYPARAVQNILLAGIERMRLTADVHTNQRIFLTVFPLDGIVGRDSGTGQESEIHAGVLENNRAIVGMNIFFHKNQISHSGKTARFYRRFSFFASKTKRKSANSTFACRINPSHSKNHHKVEKHSIFYRHKRFMVVKNHHNSLYFIKNELPRSKLRGISKIVPTVDHSAISYKP